MIIYKNHIAGIRNIITIDKFLCFVPEFSQIIKCFRSLSCLLYTSDAADDQINVLVWVVAV